MGRKPGPEEYEETGTKSIEGKEERRRRERKKTVNKKDRLGFTGGLPLIGRLRARFPRESTGPRRYVPPVLRPRP